MRCLYEGSGDTLITVSAEITVSRVRDTIGFAQVEPVTGAVIAARLWWLLRMIPLFSALFWRLALKFVEIAQGHSILERELNQCQDLQAIMAGDCYHLQAVFKLQKPRGHNVKI